MGNKQTGYHKKYGIAGPSELCLDWMKHITDDTVLSDMSVPGTHSSSTTRGWPTPDVYKTQRWSLLQQYQAGIRFVDVQFEENGNDLPVFSRGQYQHTDLHTCIMDTLQYLQTYPTEAVIMRLSNHGCSNRCPFVGELVNKHCKDGQIWKPNDVDIIPTLGEIRGKVVLLQNIPGDQLGILENSAANVFYKPEIKDYYTTTLQAKWNEMELHLEHAHSGDKMFHVTFTCGAGWKAFPCDVACYINKQLQHYLEKTTGGTRQHMGIIAMDFPGYELIELVIQCNNI